MSSRSLGKLLDNALAEVERAVKEIDLLVGRPETAESGRVQFVQEHVREAENAAMDVVLTAHEHLTGFDRTDPSTYHVLDERVDALGFMELPAFMETLGQAQSQGSTARTEMGKWLAGGAVQRVFNAEGYIVDRDVPMGELKPITDALIPLRDTLAAFRV